MSNKWKRIGQDAWVDMEKPDSWYTQFVASSKQYKDGVLKVKAYNNRTHHPIANLESGWWKEGEVKEWRKDFELTVFEGDIKLGGEPVLYTVAIPLKPQPMSERKFTLDEMKDCWGEAFDRGQQRFAFPTAHMIHYFKEKFNIDL